MDFFPCKAEPDIWLKDKIDHWEYVVIHVDDLLYVGKSADYFYDQLKTVGV